MTVAAWVKVRASALTRRGVIVGNNNEGATTQLGWGSKSLYPARTIRFTRGHGGGGTEHYAETPAGVTADTWYFAVGTYDGATIRLYMNAALVDTDADTFGDVGGEGPIKIGHGRQPTSQDMWFYGTVDEAAVWNRALTAEEINTLYQVRHGRPRPRLPVLVSDGEGGATWASPARGDEAGGRSATSSSTADGPPSNGHHAPQPPRRLLAQLQGPLPASPEISGQYRVPYALGVTVTYTLQYASLHLGDDGSSSTTVVIEKSDTTDVFTPEEITTLTVAASGHLAEDDTGLGTIESGQLLRFNWTAIGTGADNFHVTLEGTET